jgi:hypothetical protein
MPPKERRLRPDTARKEAIVWRLSVVQRVLTACLLAVSTLAPPTLGAAAQDTFGLTTDDFFNDSAVRDIYLTAKASDWATLKKNFQENTYYPCTFSWNGITIANSTMRSRGTGTRNPQKPGLRIDFNRYNTSQRFVGLKYFVLDNMWTDVAMIKERISMLLFGRLGLPAPRETHVRVFINDEYVGLYVAVEALDELFIERVQGSGTGYLFEYNWFSDYRFDYLGRELSNYEMFEPKTHTKDPASLLWGPIEEMIRSINEAPDAIFEREVSNYIDLVAFTKQIALDNFLAESDGMLGLWGLNNFYIYRAEDSPRFRFFTWDKDATFFRIDFPVMQGVSSNVLARRLLQIPSYLALYLDTMDKAATIVAGANEERGVIQPLVSRAGDRESRRLNAAPGVGWMEREIRREANQIRTAVVEDRYKSGSNEDFEYGILQLVEFARQRPGIVATGTRRIRQTLVQ